MKTFIKILTGILIFVSVISCQNSGKVKTITIENKYSIDLPAFLNETDNLNDDASLQYYNPFRELYVSVIDESKKEFHDVITEHNLDEIYSTDLEGYTNILSDSFEENVEISEISELEDKNINNMKAKIRSVDGIVEGIDIYYKIAYLEGKDDYYQIMTWTLTKYKDKFSAEMDKMISSFKEL